MLAKGISGLPVVDDRDVPRGIITEGDFLRRSEICAESRYSGKRKRCGTGDSLCQEP
ncbi:MAG: CBS domain-containing protein [Mesorhizobium sp.]